MKLIKAVGPPCDCLMRASAYQQAEGHGWCFGTVVECDCGTRVMLIETREGERWSRIMTRDGS